MIKVKLPNDKFLRGTLFPQITQLDLNDVYIPGLLPALFFRIVALGRKRARRPNTGDPNYHIGKLLQHPLLEGFDDAEGKRLLTRLVNTALVENGSIGRSNRGVQILTVVPYNILAHKPGLKSESNRLRNADTFIFHAMRDNLTFGGDYTLNKHFQDSLGKGVRIGSPPEYGGTYDGQTPLDTLSRLSIALLDTFEPAPAGHLPEEAIPNAFPSLSRALADDLMNYVFEYSGKMPPQAFISALQSLIAFELFTYAVKVVYATDELVENPARLPLAMQSAFAPSAPELYLDFTNVRGGISYEMATVCVGRDLEAYQRHHVASTKLRLLHSYADSIRKDSRRRLDLESIVGTDTFGASYLQGLLLASEDPKLSAHFGARAQLDEQRIYDANTIQLDEDGPSLDSVKWIEGLVSSALSDVDRVVALLYDARSAKLNSNSQRWFRDTGGVDKSYGLVSGTAKNRATWRYAPTNDLLGVLVQLAAIRSTDEGGVATVARDAKPIRLRAFLQYLYERFGILVDRPPAIFKGAEYVAAARANLRALERRLRQMGIFSDLSDDFTLQELTPPYMESRKNSVEEH